MSVLTISLDPKVLNALRLVSECIEIYGEHDYNFGIYEDGTNLTTQVTKLACHGCAAKGVSKHSNNWVYEFQHEEECRYLQLKWTLEEVKKLDQKISE